MKVTVVQPPESSAADRDYRESLEIRVDGKSVATFADGEPEDNTLGRNFNDVYSIANLIEQAWHAGKSGEPFEIERLEEEW